MKRIEQIEDLRHPLHPLNPLTGSNGGTKGGEVDNSAVPAGITSRGSWALRPEPNLS